jgi:hypothetical protein
LYYFAAQVVFMIILQARTKKLEINPWKHVLAVSIFVFLFYLPVFCFSGLPAFFSNKYVAPSSAPMLEFFNQVSYYSRSYIEYGYSNIAAAPSILSLVLFLVPLAFFIPSKNKNQPRFGIFFVVLVLVFIALVFLMKRYPYHRNLAGHFAILLTLTILAFFTIVKRVSELLKARAIKLLFPVILVGLSVYFLRLNPPAFSNFLYFNDATDSWNAVNKTLDEIPAGSSVSFSDQSFYWAHASRKKNLHAAKCTSGAEQYFIKEKDEKFPAEINSNQYILDKQIMYWEIWKKVGSR